jgi:hypothetical protein
MQYCAKVQLSDHLLVNTQIPTQSEVIGAKRVETSSSHLKQNFTLDADGHRSTLPQKMMQLS